MDTEQIGRVKRRLERIGSQAAERKDTELMLEIIRVRGELGYWLNAEYEDDAAERLLLHLKGKSLPHQKEDARILFYDGFGFDTRGLALIYLKALKKNGYQLLYVTAAENAEAQPQIMALLKEDQIVFSTPMTLAERLAWLRKLFIQEPFSTAFFYTTPWDAAGAAAFQELEGSCRRFQIDLTDHTLWIGTRAFDYCIEFREYGASNAVYGRGIPKEKLVELPYYPEIDRESPFQGFPFDPKGKKVIFSGGALHKTMDPAGTFYRIIDHLVTAHEDTIFLYAGWGDASKIREAEAKYPGRVYYVEERPDVYQLLRHADLYLNTYPVSGALMLQFAAEAGRVPVTLKHPWDDDPEGILIQQERLGETFTDFDACCAELDKLLTDDGYRREKEALLPGMVISEEDFTTRLDCLIRNPEPAWMENPKQYDTTLFRQAMAENFTEEMLTSAVINRETKRLYRFFPGLLAKKLLGKMHGGATSA